MPGADVVEALEHGLRVEVEPVELDAGTDGTSEANEGSAGATDAGSGPLVVADSDPATRTLIELDDPD